MLVLALIGVVLLQRSEGGGLGIGGGGGFMTSRGTANVLTRTTAILAGLFFATSLVLSILAGVDRAADLDHSAADRARRRAGAYAGERRRRRRRRRPAQPVATGAPPRSGARAPPPPRGRRCRSRSDLNEGPGQPALRRYGRWRHPRACVGRARMRDSMQPWQRRQTDHPQLTHRRRAASAAFSRSSNRIGRAKA